MDPTPALGNLDGRPFQGGWGEGPFRLLCHPALLLAAGVHKGPKFPELNTWEVAWLPPEVSRFPPLGLFTCTYLCSIFSHSLSPSRAIISKPDSSGKPSQMAKLQMLKFPPRALSARLLCCFLVASYFLLSLQLNYKLLKRKGQISYSFCASRLLYPHTGTNKYKAGFQEWGDLGHDHRLSVPSSPTFLCSLETR